LEDALVIDTKVPRMCIRDDTMFKNKFAIYTSGITVGTDDFLFIHPMPVRWWRWRIDTPRLER
jgi:hypothetical protein